MQFVGKDFLKMAPPKGYKPGVGRGAVPLTTSAERLSFPESFPKRKAASQVAASAERLEDAEDREAELIYESIESRRKRKKPRQVSQPTPTISQNKALQAVPIEEWAKLPEASDSTRWNKRLRENERSSRRMYAIPEFEPPKEQTGVSESMRPVILEMIRNQPTNEEGYLRLAELEKQSLHFDRARQALERATRKIPTNERLWLALLELETPSAARQTAARACLSLPRSEKLWRKAVEVEPTRAMQKQVVHEALLSIPKSADLWLLAADLESDETTKHKVLETAKEFADSPKLWLKLSVYEPKCLEEARARFPDNSDVLFASLEQDHSLLEQVLIVLPLTSPKWQAFLASLPVDHKLLEMVAPHFHTLTELDSLPLAHRHRLYTCLAKTSPSAELYLKWSETQPEVLEKMESLHYSDELWLAYFERSNNWPRMLSVASSASRSLLEGIALRLVKANQHEMVVQWLSNGKLDAQLTLLLIESQRKTCPEKLPALLNSALSKYPECGQLHVLHADLDPKWGKEELARSVELTKGDDQAIVLNKLANLEPIATRRRALLTKALTKHPKFGPLWLSRVELEREEHKPFAPVLTEALQQCPHFAPLWLVDILETPLRQRKRRLAEAVRLSQGSPEVLRYGAMLFEANHEKKTAKKWLQQSGLPKLDTNPFTN